MPPYILSTAHTIFLRTKRCSIDTNRSTSYYCTCREHTVLRTASSCSFEYRVSLGAEELDEPCFNHVLNRRVPLLGEQHPAPLGGFSRHFWILGVDPLDNVREGINRHRPRFDCDAAVCNVRCTEWGWGITACSIVVDDPTPSVVLFDPLVLSKLFGLVSPSITAGAFVVAFVLFF